MKKKKLIWIIATVILAAVCVAFLAVSSLDEIVSTEVTEFERGVISSYHLITHTFKNGKTVKVGVFCDYIAIDDNVHMLCIHAEKDMTRFGANEQASSASYNLSNLSFSAHIEDKDGGRVLCTHSCATGKQGESAGAGVSFAAYDSSELDCEAMTRGDYIYATYIVQGEFELSDLDISYDLNGKGMRLGSHFEEQKTTIHIGHKAPPYDTEPAEE